MAFAGLPSELLTPILRDGSLTADDQKVLRTVCRRFEELISPSLFSRVYISKLKRDRDAFIGIAASPRLAHVPRELVWYELAEDEFFLAQSLTAFRSMLPSIDRSWAGQEDMISKLRSIVSEAIWLPRCLVDGNQPGSAAGMDTALLERYLIVVEDFLALFFSAVDAMTNLQTFVSKPMPPDRVLSTTAPYQVPVDFLRGVYDPVTSPKNEGLFRFLLPAMARPEGRITALFWADELGAPSFGRLEDSHADAFKRLTRIDMCINHPMTCPDTMRGPPLPTPDDYVSRLAACLQAATELRHLTLCFESGWCQEKDFRITGEVLARLVFYPRHTWPCLASLSITDARFHDTELLVFLELHAATLRRLSLMECGRLRLSTLKNMAEIPELKLRSFLVRSEEDKAEVISEEALLDFINNKTKTCPLQHETHFSTGRLIWDPHDSARPAFFDIAEDYFEGNCKARSFYSPEDVDAIEKWAAEVDEHTDAEDEVLISDDEDGLPPSESWYGHQAAKYTQAEIRVADMRNENRKNTSPKWKWAAQVWNGDFQIYYWQSQDEDAHPTEIWRFVRKGPDGDTWDAFGDDPLEYWVDWDSEAGDDMVAEPTPFCRDFARFRMREGRRDDLRSGQSRLHELPGAVLYPGPWDDADDPYASEDEFFMLRDVNEQGGAED